ncbi:hypothetical protein Tco_0340444 [Tanacetum coccineum]
MKASMSFLVFGTIVGHKVANTWNLLTHVLRSFPFTVRWFGKKNVHQYRATSVKVPLANLPSVIGWQLKNSYVATLTAIGASLGLVVLSVFAMLVACASNCGQQLSSTSFLPDGSLSMVGAFRFWTGSLPSGRGMIHNELSNSAKIDSSKRVVDISSGGKKSQESNIGDSGNTRDGGKQAVEQ